MIDWLFICGLTVSWCLAGELQKYEISTTQ